MLEAAPPDELVHQERLDPFLALSRKVRLSPPHLRGVHPNGVFPHGAVAGGGTRDDELVLGQAQVAVALAPGGFAILPGGC